MSTHRKKQGPWKVFIAILLGMLIGSLTQADSTYFGVSIYDYTYPVFSLCGKIFINALTLVVVPLVSSSIITGIARIGNESAFGRLGAKTFGFYLGTSLMAILIGLVFVNLFNPGSSINPGIVRQLRLTSRTWKSTWPPRNQPGSPTSSSRSSPRTSSTPLAAGKCSA